MNIKQLSSTKKGQLIICCSVLVLVWGVLLISYGVSFLDDIPDQKKIENARKDLSKARSDFEKANAESIHNREIKKQYRQLAASAWLPVVDGPVETALRRKISEISEKRQFRLNSLGATNPVRINSDFSYADISIQGAGSLEDVINFLGELAKVQPRLSWRQLHLNPDNRFHRRQQSGVQSVNLAAQLNTLPATRLNFRGTLRVLVYEGKMTPDDLGVTRRPPPEPLPEAMAADLTENTVEVQP